MTDPALGVAGVEAGPSLSEALFPVRRQEASTTGVNNLESSHGAAAVRLMREGVLLRAASIPLEANGQRPAPSTRRAHDTSGFRAVGALRLVGEGLFSAALEMGPSGQHLHHAAGGTGPRDAGSGIEPVVSLSCLGNMGE